MNGARAAVPADPRPAAPEAASRRRSEPVVLVPVSEAPAASVPASTPLAATRDRVQAALAPAPEAAPEAAAPAGEPAAVLTTRDRIANRAREAAAPPIVVPVAEVEARRQARKAAAPSAAPTDGPAAAVIPLRREQPISTPGRPATPARGPPEAAPESTAAPARPSPAPAPTPVGGVRPEPGTAAPVTPAAGAEPSSPAAVAPAAAPAPAPAGEAPAAAPAPAAEKPAGPEGAAPAAKAGPAPAAPAAPSAAPAPEESRVDAFRTRAQAAAGRAKHHSPAAKAADNAQAASKPDPVADVGRQAAEEQVNAMGDAEPGRFDADAFKVELQKAIAGMAPPATEEAAEDVEKSTDPGPAKDAVHGVVTGGRTTAESAIKTTTESDPKRDDKKPKMPEKLVNDPSRPALPAVDAAAAMPAEKPPEAADFSAATGEIDTKMQENGLTQDQLAESNEPTFTAVLDARDAARTQAGGAPMEYQAHEQVVLANARGEADAAAVPQVEAISGRRAGVLAHVLDVKQKTSESDAKQRDDVNAAILDIHKKTRDDVHEMLTALDEKVEKLFTAYEESARADFEADVGLKMQNYKDERYSGLSGIYHSGRDYFRGLPKEVDQFYADGREKYLRAMERALDKLANLIVTTLFAAHLRILWGRAQVKTYVEETLPASLRQLGRETADTLDHNFDTLESDIDAKRDELVQTIARKYVDAQAALDTRIDELKAENRGLIDKAIDATIGVAKTIYELGKMLLRVLIKAAEAIGDIVAHPIRFLENLIDAVGGGLNRFVDRIGVHLQDALMDLLFGELGGAGVTMPSALDFAGIVDLVLQVLGLTYGRIRERVVRRFGEPVVARLEQTVDIFTTLVREGIAGLWAQIREKLSDLEDLVIGKIKEYVIERVVMAGINYILALLTPVGAFIKACQTIYKIVMFIVEKAKQIADFVDAVLDSISAIATGDIASAVLKVEGALAGALKLAIKFLAELLNLGGLAAKVRSIIDLIRAPITKIVDAIVFGAADLFSKTVAFVQGKVVPRKDAHGKEVTKRDLKPHEIDVAKHADLAKETASAEHVPIHEPFRIADERHEIVDDGTGVLVVASDGGQPVAGIAELTVLNQDYRALPANVPQVRRAEILEQMIALLKQNPGLIVHARAQLHDPPNLGEVNRHRTNSGLAFRPQSTNPPEPQFAPLWEMESEHVLSVAAVGATFVGIGLGSQIERPSDEDNYMHTVMLYSGAAHSKTYGPAGDHRLIDQHHGELLGVRRELDRLRWDERHAKNIRLVFRELLGHLYDWGQAAVQRTKNAVRDEQRENAVHRGRTPSDPPIPSDSKIEDAYALQIRDVGELARRRYEAQE